MEKPDLEELQKETSDKENIVLAMHAGLAAFSLACLLRLITLPSESILVVIASCMFVTSLISFLLIVLSKHHVLHQAKEMHIGHVIVSEDSAKYPQVIGVTCLVFGFLLMLLYISYFTFATGLIALFFAGKHHNNFKVKMDKMMGARKAAEMNESA